jgi:hypothetical protein
VIRRLVLLLGVGTLLSAASCAPAAARSCAGFYAHRSHSAILSLDPRAGSPRVFAMQYKQQAHNVVSYASFRTKIECMLRRYVLGHLARGRPNVVVFNEDVGLATLGIGSRGALARSLFTQPDGPACSRLGAGQPCGSIGALALLDAAYARQLAAYKARFGSVGGLGKAFVAGTDTIVRGFMGTFSALAKRYRIYMIGSGDVTPFVQSSRPGDVATFADPDLHPRPASVYVATSPHVFNHVFMWGPHDVRHAGPEVMRNVVASNLKVPLTSLEVALGFTAGPSSGPAAVRNLRPYRLPGTSARIGFATSLPAFMWGSLPSGVNPCSNVSLYYMRCLSRLGANLVIQDEANPGAWTGPDGDGIEKWQPLSWMGSTYRTVSDPSVGFDYNVTAMMVGNLADLTFDGQSAITQRGLHGPGCHYIGNAAFVPGEDQAVFRRYAGSKPDFLALAPWVVPDGPRASLRAVGTALGPGSGSRKSDDYLETALVADLPFPVDRGRRGCAGA